MANNIKITGNIINTTTVTRYSSDDTNLISSQNLQENFGGTGDYIEYYIYDAGGNLLNTNYNYLDYKLPTTTGLTPAVSNNPNTTGNIQTTDVGITSTLVTPTSSLYPTIEIDPVKDIQNIGYTSGEFNSRYNFFRNILSNNIDRALFIKEISQDRTEIRLASTTLTNDEIESTVNNVINQINSSSYYVDYLLNFGDNQQYVAVNIALNKATTGYEVLFKMYESLPPEVQEKQTLWVVEEKVSPYVFDINLDTLIIPPPPPTLRGPNFDISIPNQGTVSTTYTNYDTALMTLQSLQNSSYQQLLNLMTTQSISINVDYTDFNNFTFFGSAYQRVANFYTKVQQIEDYINLINLYTPYVATTASLQTEINQYSSNINTLITQFDGYESYLYFESSSYAWPKSGSYKPYSLLSTGSAAVINWYGALTGSALDYDYNNYDNLVYAVPNFIRDDENNAQYLTFLNMVGQYFDNIWIYLKAVTDINLANNNLNAGISKDLVYNQLQSLGIKLYNSQAGESVDQFLIGANTGSSIFDNDFSLTGSYLNNIPRKDLLAELYKRIYHNLPLLLKTKGTKSGLEYLITTFGIPSRTYITGSSISSSILNVKEYGGSLKSDLIKGYNDEKVRIVSNTITGSILSPLLSLQTFHTNSNTFRENDSHFIDISFSPETQINTYISGAIASNNPTWSLDDYIGDPRQLYNNSYPDLNEQRTLYFETGVPGFSGFTGSYMDYNGFIRLIQFFDNALFKMLGDFVPERTSLSTGVTIESPVLERNKAAYSIPNIINQEVYDAEYPAPVISEQYDNLYNNLGGDKAAYFTGEISGSEFDIHHIFEEANFNPYLGNWDIYNAQHSVSKSIDINKFIHSDYDVLFNNVSENVTSRYRKDIEYIWGTTGSILVPTQLQDSYLTLRSYNISRYEGSKLTSLKYNNYTSTNYTGSDGLTIQTGDISYGKTAAIDRNVRKIGLFTQVITSSFLPKRNSVALKYLVDEFGELYELNQTNKYWCDVQRTFMMSKTASIALFDNKKYSNQKSTDGQKTVFDSGYTYTPVLYGTGNDRRLYFDHTGDTPTYKSVATFYSSPNNYISGSSLLSYPIIGSGGSKGLVQDIYNKITEDPDGNFKAVSPCASQSYQVPDGGTYNINASVSITMDISASIYGSSSFTLKILNGSTSIKSGSTTFNFSVGGTEYLGQPAFSYGSTGLIYGTPVTVIKTGMVLSSGSFSQTYNPGDTLYKYTISGEWYDNYDNPNGGGSGPCSLDGNSLGSTLYSPNSSIFLTSIAHCNNIVKAQPNKGMYAISDFDVPNDAPQSATQDISISIPNTTFSTNDKINIILSQSSTAFLASGTPTGNYTASISSGTLTINSLSSLVGNFPYTPIEYFVTESNPSYSSLGGNQLALTSSLGSFYSPGYIFLPTYVSASTTYTSSLYSQYGDVDYPFQLGVFDIFIAYDTSGSYLETRITDITKDTSGSVILSFADFVPTSLKYQLENLNTNKAAKFLFLKRVEDETNTYLKFIKRPGSTSYGFLIPEDLAPDVLANINTITRQVKQKLLADQQGTTQ